MSKIRSSGRPAAGYRRGLARLGKIAALVGVITLGGIEGSAIAQANDAIFREMPVSEGVEVALLAVDIDGGMTGLDSGDLVWGDRPNSGRWSIAKGGEKNGPGVLGADNRGLARFLVESRSWEFGFEPHGAAGFLGKIANDDAAPSDDLVGRGEAEVLGNKPEVQSIRKVNYNAGIAFQDIGSQLPMFSIARYAYLHSSGDGNYYGKASINPYAPSSSFSPKKYLSIVFGLTIIGGIILGFKGIDRENDGMIFGGLLIYGIGMLLWMGWVIGGHVPSTPGTYYPDSIFVIPGYLCPAWVSGCP